MNNYCLTDQELSDLQALHRQLTDKRQADRVKAIFLLGSGCSPSKVAQVLLIDRTTVRTYGRNYQKGGVDRLLESSYSGSQG